MSAKKMSTMDEFEVDELEAENTNPEAERVTEVVKQANPLPSTNGNGKAAQPFDPTQYLSKFDGRDYLEVKWRLLWLRSQHPDARIATEIVQHNEENGFALFRAEVEIPDGGKATGWGSETVRDFHDYIEAAETKSLGRALAALGYGTQFCTDFDFADKARPGRPQVVDAPVNLAQPRNIVDKASSFGRSNQTNGQIRESQSGFTSGNFTNRPVVQTTLGGRLPAEQDEFDQLPQASASPSGSAATEKQIKAIYAIGRVSKRLSESQVDDRSEEVFGVATNGLTKAEASQFIDLLKGEAAA